MTMLDDTPGTAPPVPPPATRPTGAAAATPPPAPGSTPLEHAPTGRRPASRGQLVAVLVAGLGLALLLAVVAVLTMSGSRPPAGPGASYGVVIPEGTGRRIASGFHLYLIPDNLQLHVGDTLVVVNQDTQVHEVGPFFVRPGETMRHTFTEPGRFVGACTFHPAGEVAIEVFEPHVPIQPPYIPPQQYN